MSLGLGVIGCGSVFAGPYRGMIERLRADGRVRVSAVYDVDADKRRGAATHYGLDPDLQDPAASSERARVTGCSSARRTSSSARRSVRSMLRFAKAGSVGF